MLAPAPSPWRALDNSDVASELLHPILIQPSPPKPTAMKKKAGNGWGPDLAAPQQRARSVTKPAEVTYPRQGQGGHTPRLDLGAVAPSLLPKPSSQCGPVALGGRGIVRVVADTGGVFAPPVRGILHGGGAGPAAASGAVGGAAAGTEGQELPLLPSLGNTGNPK